MIPKVIHQIWLGPKPRPAADMDGWRDTHIPLGWEYRLWTEADLRPQIDHVDNCIANDAGGVSFKPVGCLCPRRSAFQLRHRSLFDAFAEVYHAQADILRYEILSQLGGIYLDADTICLQPLDERFLDVEEGAWATAENDEGLLANGFMGATAKHPLLDAILADLDNLHVPAIAGETREELHGAAWVLTGPCCLSEAVKQSKIPIRAFPNHYFMPEHHDGSVYTGNGPVFGRHWWGSTFRKY